MLKYTRISGTTVCECIPFETNWTAAHGYMIDHVAYRIAGTSTDTRIFALVPDTGSITRTIIVQHTLWSTTKSRVSIVFGQARTNSIVALSVRSTRRWIA